MKTVPVGAQVRVVRVSRGPLLWEGSRLLSVGRVGVVIGASRGKSAQWPRVEWRGVKGNVIGRSKVPAAWLEVI